MKNDLEYNLREGTLIKNHTKDLISFLERIPDSPVKTAYVEGDMVVVNGSPLSIGFPPVDSTPHDKKLVEIFGMFTFSGDFPALDLESVNTEGVNQVVLGAFSEIKAAKGLKLIKHPKIYEIYLEMVQKEDKKLKPLNHLRYLWD